MLFYTLQFLDVFVLDLKVKLSKTRAYQTWVDMRRRCESVGRPECKRYGARGIKVCRRWEEFRNFYADMGERPLRAQIDRIDNDGNYEPQNCRWVTAKENCRNKSNNVFINFRGENKSVSQWSDETGINATTIFYRIGVGKVGAEIFQDNRIRVPAAKLCKRGHKFDRKNTYVQPGKQRHCRQCRKIREKAYAKGSK